MVSTLIENNPYEAEFHMNDYESKLKEIQAILQSMEGNENNEETVKLLRLQQYSSIC